MPQFFQMQDIGAIIPELELAVFGMFLLIFDLLIQEKRKLGYIALAGIAISGFFLFRLSGMVGSFAAYGGSLVLDPFAIFFKMVFLVAAALSIAISLRYLDIERCRVGIGHGRRSLLRRQGANQRMQQLADRHGCIPLARRTGA